MNNMFHCECGSIIKKKSKKNHFKTMRHIRNKDKLENAIISSKYQTKEWRQSHYIGGKSTEYGEEKVELIIED